MSTRDSFRFSTRDSRSSMRNSKLSTSRTSQGDSRTSGSKLSTTTNRSSASKFLPSNIVRPQLEIDFDLSTAGFERRRSSSLESSIIEPRLSVGSKSEDRAGKKVIFVLHEKPEKSYEPRTIGLGSLPKSIKEESVKYSLEHKFTRSLETIFRTQSGVESKTPVASSRESNAFDESFIIRESKDVEPAGEVYFTGDMIQQDPAFLDNQGVPEMIDSQDVSIGSSVSFLATELWPWPWLNPESRAKDIYRHHDNERVTFENQNSLPCLPLPILGRSLSRYLQTVRPCVTSSQYMEIEKIIDTFANNEGKVCHEKFLEIVEPGENWIKHMLPNHSHCYSRQEAMLLNTAIVAPFMYDLWPEKPNTQLERASVLVEIALEFFCLINTELLLPISDEKGNQICMHQFRKLFSSSKIPGIPQDAVFSFFKTTPEGQNTPRHIIVMYKGQMFSIDVLDQNYVPFSRARIKQQLLEIMLSVDKGNVDTKASVGIFTSLDRNAWSQVRVQLMGLSDNNKHCLQEIERSMFILSLDHVNVSNVARLSHESIFADGCNRWYDKCLNFYVFNNGLVTVNANATLVDGSVVAFLLHYIHLRIMEDDEKWDDEVLESVSKNVLRSSRGSFVNELLIKVKERRSEISNSVLNKDTPALSETNILDDVTIIPRVLIFNLNKQLEKQLEDAKMTFGILAATFSTAVCKFDGYERKLFQHKNIDTDAFAHLVMHLTFFRMYYRMASVASPTSLKRFHHGRYELMRTATMEALEWCKIMLDPATKIIDRRNIFWKAVHKHKTLLKENCSGQGFESHMAALKIIAEEMYPEPLPIFSNDIFHWTGDRFDIYSECLALGCPSGVVVLPRNPKGYGVGYFVANTRIMFYVSSLNDEPTTSADLFACSLEYTLTNLSDFLNLL